MKFTDRQSLSFMALVSGVSLACYTAVLRLCRLEAKEHQPERAARRNQLANFAHLLDWVMNAMVVLVGIQRLYREENFGGQHQPHWLKVYFMITGPLPTIGMLGAMITGHRWGPRLGADPTRRRIHRALAWLGYISWWLSYLPIFAQPLLNRANARRASIVMKDAEQLNR
ncbi:MAG: hypothetical protein HGA45_09950 [Chloroflexales bacterium]|nr:hypothetical protein [Chloroflexales bacterium]